MRADGYAAAEGLLDRQTHRLGIASVPATRHIGRGDGLHQRFLDSFDNRFGHLAHVAIQIDLEPGVLHARINSFDASHLSCSAKSVRAVSNSAGTNRISSRGFNCPRLAKSAEITLAIFG